MAKRNGSRNKRRSTAITRRDPAIMRARKIAQAMDSDGEGGDDDKPADSSSDESSPSASGEEQERVSADARAEQSDEGSGGDGSGGDGSGGDGSGGDGSGGDELPADAPGWVVALFKLEKRWTWFETRLLFAALMALMLVLCLWIILRGMKEPLQAENAAGTIFRSGAGAAILGGLVRLFTRRLGMEERKRTIVTTMAVLIGLVTGGLWRGVGIEYFGGVLDWLQEGSSITLFGGLKGISTRLTMLVALVGASLAAASGTHINIDVVVRFIAKKWRRPVALAGSVATAAVCLVASYGFLDFIAATGFKADANAPISAKVVKIGEGLNEQFFVWRKQMRLDLAALPSVAMGERWDNDARMTGQEWNTFLDEGGFIERYGAEKIATIKAPPDALKAPRVPFVAIPASNPRGIMVHGMDLIFPLGFLFIALRVLLRAGLIFAGVVSAERDDEEAVDETATVERQS